MYSPKPYLGSDLAGLSQYLQEELQAISRDQQETQALDLRAVHAEPKKPRRGMIVYADGVDWDPGSGPGAYSWSGSVWTFLEAQGADTSIFLQRANNLSDLTNVGDAVSNLELATVASTGDYTDLINKPSSPVLLATGTPSGGIITFAGDLTSAFSKYRFELIDLVAASSSASTIFQVSTDGGATWKSTLYFFMGRQQTTAPGGADDGSTVGGGIPLHHQANTQLAGTPIDGWLELTNPASTSFVKDVSLNVRYTDTGGTNCSFIGHGFWSAGTTAINAVRFLNQGSGGLSSGTIKMYGIP